MGDAHVNERDQEYNLDIAENISHRPESTHRLSTPCRLGCSKWCSKYFWEGQSLNKQQQQALLNISDDAPWHVRVLVKHRRQLGLVIPAIFFHFCWWGIAIKHDIWHIFKDKYFMSITMVFGSMIAGMTSEGGGAVAFPVMTLGFGIKPMVARDFSLMIQSCGMTAAAFTIFFMKVRLEWNALVFCSLGGMFGMIFGLYVVDPALKPAHKKMAFVCIWFSFAFALFLLNRYRKRRTFKAIPQLKVWKILVLLATGFMGGIFSSFAGSGLDICTFSVITLLFRVTEKTATPTSVVLMAGNTVVGFYWRQVMMTDVSDDAWQYFAVCVPVVVIGATLGSVIGSHFHRLVLAALIYLLDTIALITAFIIVPQSPILACVSVGIILIGFGFFFLLTILGNKVLVSIPEDQKSSDQIPYISQKELSSTNTEKFQDSICSK